MSFTSEKSEVMEQHNQSLPSVFKAVTLWNVLRHARLGKETAVFGATETCEVNFTHKQYFVSNCDKNYVLGIINYSQM